MRKVFFILFLLCAVTGFAQSPPASFWTQLQPPSSPEAREGSCMIYNPISQLIYLFGGSNGTTLLNDTWVFNGQTWSELSSVNAPSQRVFGAMAFDNTLLGAGEGILFGGYDNSFNPLNDTWILGRAGWTQLNPATSPPARYEASMAYDSHSNRMILFGGITGGSVLSDTWAFDGSTWVQLSPPTSPPGRCLASMASDKAGHIILFGGQNSSGLPLNDTWTFDGTSWIELSPSVSPAPKYSAFFAYDSNSAQFVLYGGIEFNKGFLEAFDTWVFNGITWEQLNPSGLPDASYNGSASSFNAANSQWIMFGGSHFDPIQKNNVPTDETFSFVMNFAPRFTSLNTVAFPLTVNSSFSVTTVGYPTASIILSSGTLPEGVSLVDNGNGTATLQGTPVAEVGSLYSLGLTASNGITPEATQTLYLVISGESTSLQASSHSINNGESLTLTASPPGSYTSGTISFYEAISLEEFVSLGSAPVQQGQAALEISSLLPGVHSFYATYNETFSTSSPLIVTVLIPHPPEKARGVQKCNRFATQTDVVNKLSWVPPKEGSPVVAYEIYTNAQLTKLVKRVTQAPWRFDDHHQKKGEKKVYYLVSVDSAGNKSKPAVVTIKTK